MKSILEPLLIPLPVHRRINLKVFIDYDKHGKILDKYIQPDTIHQH